MDISKYKRDIIDNLKVVVKSDVNSGVDRPYTDYLDCALDILKRHFQIEKKWSRYKPWSSESTKEVTGIWMEVQQEILSAIEGYIQEFKHKKLIKEIKATTARAAIKAAMQEAGLKHHFTGQTHRAKVSVLLTSNRALTIYISYKKMNEQLPRIIESLKIIRQELEFLGTNISINKAFNINEFV